uniref:Uncharacterized protein n=1 Tax=Rhizophora mucronata TaxID=61149 RepID=A0A2P2NZ58_RHIMU
MLGDNGPLSLLSEISRNCKLLGRVLGTEPVIAFEWRSRNSRFWHPDIDGGIAPTR